MSTKIHLLFNGNDAKHSFWAACLGTIGVKPICYLSGSLTEEELPTIGQSESKFLLSCPAFSRPELDSWTKLDNVDVFVPELPASIKHAFWRYSDTCQSIIHGYRIMHPDSKKRTMYDIFFSIITEVDFDVSKISKYVFYASVKTSVLELMATELIPITIGKTKMFRVSESSPYRIARETRDSDEIVCQYIDIKGDMVVYSYNGVPPELITLEVNKEHDPLLNIPCNIIKVPLSIWAKLVQ